MGDLNNLKEFGGSAVAIILCISVLGKIVHKFVDQAGEYLKCYITEHVNTLHFMKSEIQKKDARYEELLGEYRNLVKTNSVLTEQMGTVIQKIDYMARGLPCNSSEPCNKLKKEE